MFLSRIYPLDNKIAYKCATKMYATFEQPSSLTKIEHVGAVTRLVGTKSDLPQELEENPSIF